MLGFTDWRACWSSAERSPKRERRRFTLGAAIVLITVGLSDLAAQVLVEELEWWLDDSGPRRPRSSLPIFAAGTPAASRGDLAALGSMCCYQTANDPIDESLRILTITRTFVDELQDLFIHSLSVTRKLA